MTQMTLVTMLGEAGRFRHSVSAVTQVSRSRGNRHDRQHRHAAPKAPAGQPPFAILVGDSQGQQYIAVMAGQMLAGEVGLQLRITYGGKQLRHRAPKLPVRQKEIRHLKTKSGMRSFRKSSALSASVISHRTPRICIFSFFSSTSRPVMQRVAQSPKRSSLRRIIPVSATPKMPVEPVISLKILLLSRSFRV